MSSILLLSVYAEKQTHCYKPKQLTMMTSFYHKSTFLSEIGFKGMYYMIYTYLKIHADISLKANQQLTQAKKKICSQV